jgi:competence protein ComFC
MSAILTFLLELLFPEHCVFCCAEGNLLCQACCQKLTVTAARGSVLQKGKYLKQVFVATDYKQVEVAELIQLYKYQGISRLAEPFSGVLTVCLRTILSKHDMGIDLVMPVPLHLKRQTRRGFNQSALLAQRVGKYFSWEVVENALIRRVYTVPQVTLNEQQRKSNVSGAFTVRDVSRVVGRTVLLIDDVVTSGATLDECAKILLESGARVVYGAVIAHG